MFKICRTDFSLRGGFSAIFMADLTPIMHRILHCEIQAGDKFLPVILGKARSFAPSYSVKTENQSQGQAACFFFNQPAVFLRQSRLSLSWAWKGNLVE